MKNLSLRGQVELKDRWRVVMRDPAGANQRWSDAEYYHALNRSLDTWSNRVRVPWLYTVSGGWSSDTYAYALPSYMDAYIRPQVIAPVEAWRENTPAGTVETWDDVNGWTVEPDGTGGYKLRWQTPPVNDEGRIIWFMPVSRVPATLPTVTTEIDGNATTVTLTLVEDFPAGRAGWIKCEDEWMQYAGVTRTSDTSITLDTLVRGVYGTTAATHAAGAEVEWGIAVDRDDLWGVLDDQTMEHLHAYYMTDASNSERDHHAVMMKYHGDRVNLFWRGYVPSFIPRMKVHREGLGPRMY